MENGVAVKSKEFAIKIIGLYKQLIEREREFVLSKQVLRSGTSIGALIREAEHGQSKADFLSKMNIALKEANETAYWLELLNETNYLSGSEYDIINSKCQEILKMLIKIVKTTKTSLNR
jgi:four helix bundle protein